MRDRRVPKSVTKSGSEVLSTLLVVWNPIRWTWLKRLWGVGVQSGLAKFRSHLSVVSECVRGPFFVKVGANDGITGDPCSDILANGNSWRGVLVEPVPFLCEKLRDNFQDRRRFAIECCAVGQSGTSDFFYIDQAAIRHVSDLPAWFDQIGSFDSAHIAKHFGARVSPYVRSLPVQAVPLHKIFERHSVSTCHLLHVDTEGWDYEVLRTLDWFRWKPWMVFVEHKHLSQSDRDGVIGLLRSNGYEVMDCGSDFYAVLGDVGNLLDALKHRHMLDLRKVLTGVAKWVARKMPPRVFRSI